LRGVVLADTGPLYALRDTSDSFHRKSRQDLSRLKAENLKVVVAYSTLVESYALALRKLGVVESHSFLKYLGRTAIFTNPTVEDYERASARVLRYPDQDVSLADAICAEVGERFDVPIWTFDHHFDVMEARVWR
jgi:uncharacterized protein